MQILYCAVMSRTLSYTKSITDIIDFFSLLTLQTSVNLWESESLEYVTWHTHTHTYTPEKAEQQAHPSTFCAQLESLQTMTLKNITHYNKTVDLQV